MRGIWFSIAMVGILMVTCTGEKKSPTPDVLSATSVQIFQTDKLEGSRLSRIGEVEFKAFGQPLENQACIFIDPKKTFQTIVGIGGALTDAAAETFASLSPEKQQELLTAYFDAEKGIGYTLARTNIQSCDFSSESYTYMDVGDVELNTFNVDHDRKFRIPFIKKAFATAGKPLALFASPWSPPAWMKTNKDMLHGGKLQVGYRQTWANCFVHFIREYEADGIPIWGLSVQNEPMATQTWESCIYTAEEERDFVKDFLGPTLAKTGLADKKVIIWDHNRDLIYQRASTVLNDSKAARYIWGIGFHWYMQDAFDNIKRVHEAFPEQNLIFTEGCGYPYSDENRADWQWGEKYATSMVHDFNNGVVGWTDWNVLLDERGGPNHVGNYCLAPVHKTSSGDLYYMNSFYYLGHFSKFVRPGAKRIIASSNRDKLLTTAFLNSDGKIAVVVLNTTDDKIPYQLWWDGQAASINSAPHSIMTLIVHK